MNVLTFSFNSESSPYMLGYMQKKFGITYDGNALIYVFQTPAEDCIHPPTYSSLHFAEVGQRRSMKTGQRKSLL